MKKKLTILSILILCILVPVSAGSTTRFGMTGSYNNITAMPEMGMYMTSSFVDGRTPNPVHLGFGLRMDMNATIPIERMDMEFISGLAIDFKLKHNWGLEMLIGPAFGVSTPLKSSRNEGMSVGGGAELTATYYLDGNRTSGISFGIAGSGGMYLPDESDKAASPYGKVTGFFGFTFRTSSHSMYYGSNDIYITF